MKRRALFLLPVLMAALALQVPMTFGAGAQKGPPRLAFFGLHLQNDNEGSEPVSDAERNRIGVIEREFTTSVEATGSYAIVPLTSDIRAKIASGQPVGSCGGCEAAFGKELKADRVAWLGVQKISNHILSMNLYIADPATGKLTFVKSVEMGSNTDEAWSRSLKYLLDNHLSDQKS